MSFYLNDGGLFWPTAENALVIERKLPAGNYMVGLHPQRGYYLKPISDFSFSGKVYGKMSAQAARILNTFEMRPNSTGVLLSGEKGSGKTMLAKLISKIGQDKSIPTVVINQPHCGDGFNTFIQEIGEAAIIVFDEFEKVYESKEQESILTLLDGVFPSKKLFILTCNHLYRIDEHMRNRPGRIFYSIEFGGLEPDFIREYCADNLENKSHVESIVNLSGLFGAFNFDILKALVEEMNRYNESPQEALEMLNVSPVGSSEKYTVTITHKGKLIKDSDINAGQAENSNPALKSKVSLSFDPDPEGDGDWINLELYNENLISAESDVKKGIYTYLTKDGETRVLFVKDAIRSGYDWRSLLS